MKICPNCKKENGSGDRFCIGCGAPLPEQEVPAAPTYQPVMPPQEDHTISTGKWVLYQLIPMIPIFGGLVYLVMLFVWGFGDGNKNETFRNWARSSLIMMAVSTVLSILLIAVLITAFSGWFFELADVMNY